MAGMSMKSNKRKMVLGTGHGWLEYLETPVGEPVPWVCWFHGCAEVGF